MQSLKWVDTTYVQKHKSEDPNTLRAMYYPNMVMYSTKGGVGVSKPVPEALMLFLRRYGRKVGMLLAVYMVSLLPVIGRFVMPAASFYTFRNSVGTTPAAVIFGTGLVLPKRFLVTFLHSYFASRSLMRELVSIPDRFLADTDNPARTVFLPYQIHPGAEASMVPRSRRRLIWFRIWFHSRLENAFSRRPYVRCC